jgi:hypothetical protein
MWVCACHMAHIEVEDWPRGARKREPDDDDHPRKRRDYDRDRDRDRDHHGKGDKEPKGSAVELKPAPRVIKS